MVVAGQVVAPEDGQVEAGAAGQVDGAEPNEADAPGGGEPVQAVPVAGGETEEREGSTGGDEPRQESAEPEPPSEPTDIAALSARFPWLTEQLEERDGVQRNAGAQQREDRLKREAGSKQQTQANVARLLDTWGEMQPEEREQSAHYMYELANANSAVELAKGFAGSLTTQFKVPAEFHERALERREANDFDGYVTELGNGIRAAYLREVDGSDVPEGSKLHAWITSEVNRRLADEIRASGIEARPQQAGSPRTRGGGSPDQHESFDITTLVGLSKAYAAGQFTEDQYRAEWNKIRAAN